MSNISSGFTDEEIAACHYLEQVGCFTWTLVVKVKTCMCVFHPHVPEETENGVECGVYEVQADAMAYMPMDHHLSVKLYFATKELDKSRQAQDLLQAGRVVIIRCNCWDIDDPITLYISDVLDELSQQVSRLPPDHEQVVSALIDKTIPYKYSRKDA